MAIFGLALFVFLFLMITPKFREMTGHVMGNAGDWIVKYAPFSYIVLAIITLVPIVAAIVVFRWPEPPKPEDPLAKYKGGEDVIPD